MDKYEELEREIKKLQERVFLLEMIILNDKVLNPKRQEIIEILKKKGIIK